MGTLSDQLEEALARRPRHDEREVAGGRYAKSPPCDACGKPCGTEYETDAEVCGNTDGPGFFLCSRKRCQHRREGMSVDERRALYTAQRAKNTGL